jgi:hypothetical protein
MNCAYFLAGKLLFHVKHKGPHTQAALLGDSLSSGIMIPSINGGYKNENPPIIDFFIHHLILFLYVNGSERICLGRQFAGK